MYYILLAIFFSILFLIGYLKKRFKISFSYQVTIAMLLGLGFGLLSLQLLSSDSLNKLRGNWYALIGYGYIDFLKMLIIPLVPTSIIAGILKLNNSDDLKKIGVRTFLTFFLTAAAASLIGLVIATITRVGSGISLENAGFGGNEETINSVFDQIRSLIPKNPIAAAADLNLIPVVFFAVLIGVAAVIESSRNPEGVKPFKDVIESFLNVVLRLTKMVISLTPYGVFGLMAYWMSNEAGIDALSELAYFVLVIAAACLIHILVTYGSIIRFGVRVSFSKFIKLASPAMILAFTSRSSMGTLTVSIRTLVERIKVKEKIANFVAPVGAVMNMDACGGIFPAVVSVFAANAYGITLSPTDYVVIMITSILASIGTAGVPMGATLFTTITLAAVGLPLEVIGLIAGVDFIVDMFRTSTNVTGDLVTATYVAHSVGEFDREAFNKS